MTGQDVVYSLLDNAKLLQGVIWFTSDLNRFVMLPFPPPYPAFYV